MCMCVCMHALPHYESSAIPNVRLFQAWTLTHVRGCQRKHRTSTYISISDKQWVFFFSLSMTYAIFLLQLSVFCLNSNLTGCPYFHLLNLEGLCAHKYTHWWLSTSHEYADVSWCLWGSCAKIPAIPRLRGARAFANKAVVIECKPCNPPMYCRSPLDYI